MLEVARAMAEKGASRAEIEAALAAMQTGKVPAARRPCTGKAARRTAAARARAQ